MPPARIAQAGGWKKLKQDFLPANVPGAPPGLSAAPPQPASMMIWPSLLGFAFSDAGASFGQFHDGHLGNPRCPNWRGLKKTN